MTKYVRQARVDITEVDREVFLVEPDSDEIYYLDEITSGIWRLLAEPTTSEDMATVLRAAFPDVDPARIQADLATALRDLLARDLVAEIK